MKANVSGENMTPYQWYQEKLALGALEPCEHQHLAMVLLDGIAHDVTNRRWWSRSARGLYLHGGVGRGKTVLMELFFQQVKTPQKRLCHFHRFILDVHQQLQHLHGRKNPIEILAKEMARSYRVVCLDEFLVEDVADAMVLGILIPAILKRGVVLITTSNTPPGALYDRGVQRDRFVPAITAIEQHCHVHCMGGELDFRLQHLSHESTLFDAKVSEHAQAMRLTFEHLAPVGAQRADSVVVGQRPIPAVDVAEDVVWFDFSVLCEGSHSRYDFIQLARCYHAIFLSNVPIMYAKDDASAKRFVHLIDTLYERRVKLIMSAQTDIKDLYQGCRLATEFERTRSRLQEMQTHAYLALPHGPLHKP